MLDFILMMCRGTIVFIAMSAVVIAILGIPTGIFMSLLHYPEYSFPILILGMIFFLGKTANS